LLDATTLDAGRGEPMPPRDDSAAE